MTRELEMRSEFRELRAAVYHKGSFEKPDLKSTPKYHDAYRLFPRLLGEIVVSPLPEEDVELCDRDEAWRLFDDAFQKDSSAFHHFEYANYYAIGVEGLLMRHALRLDDSSFVANRRVAVLSKGGLGFVPAGSRPGDEVYAFLMGLNFHMLVLRPYPNASAADMTDVEYKSENLNNRGWSNIRPFTLVGCAYIRWPWTAAFKEAPGNFAGFRNAGEPTDKFRDRKTTALLY